MEAREEVRYSITENGITKTTSVDKVENGYIISVEKYGDRKKTNCSCESKNCDCKEWFNEVKKYISKTNPLAKKDDAADMFELIQGMTIVG